MPGIGLHTCLSPTETGSALLKVTIPSANIANTLRTHEPINAQPGSNSLGAYTAVRERPETAPAGGTRRASQSRAKWPAPATPAAAGNGNPLNIQGWTSKRLPRRERGVSARAVEARLDDLRADEKGRCRTQGGHSGVAAQFLRNGGGGEAASVSLHEETVSLILCGWLSFKDNAKHRAPMAVSVSGRRPSLVKYQVVFCRS